jgi:SAM-dependent methyltransferase
MPPRRRRLKPYPYERTAPLYDLLVFDGPGESVEMNRFLHRLFRRRGVETVLDLTCGTGAQAVGLARYGYRVTASDLSPAMLAEARRKARGLGVRFRCGDMTTLRAGRFDAAISIFNAVGHLEPERFAKAIRNVRANLKPGGTYVFDIFNLEYMRAGAFRDYEYIDLAKEQDGLHVVRFNDNRLDRERGVMHIRHRTIIQRGGAKPETLRETWDMQIYTADQIRGMLKENGFPRVRLHGGPGLPFSAKKSPFILAVAKSARGVQA